MPDRRLTCVSWKPSTLHTSAKPGTRLPSSVLFATREIDKLPVDGPCANSFDIRSVSEPACALVSHHSSAHNLCSEEENLLTKRTSMEQHAVSINKSRCGFFHQLTVTRLWNSFFVISFLARG